MRSNPAQMNFSSGEVSPLLWGRSDYQRVQNGVRQCRGFLPLRQGGMTRAPGTVFRGATRGNAEARLIPFEFAANDAVVLEFSALKMRVWRYGALVLDGSSPYELTTPYDIAAVRRMKFVQSADVIYLVDGQLPPQRLARSALNSWSIAAASFRRGPFQVENDDTGVTIKASGATGTVTLTGVGGPFEAGHVGGFMQLRAIDDDDIPDWVGNKTVAVGDQCRYDGRIYEVVAGNDSGVNPPVHHEGTVKSGQAGYATWRFVSDMIGIVRITARANSNSATATVVKRIPSPLISDPTYRWSEGAWSEKNGWPAAIAIYDQRLVLAATPRDPRTVWFSTLGGFLDFEPGTDADSAFAYSIAGGRSQNRILWLQAGARGLHVGALGEEFSTRSGTASEAIGPTNIVFGTDSTIGSRDVQPVAPDGRPIFISRDGTRVFELRYQFDQDANTPIELSLPSEHLGFEDFREIDWQSAPSRVGWVRRGNGELAICIYDPVEDVLGWAVHSLADGACESVAISSSPDGTSDIVMMVVRRTVAGQSVRYVEEVSSFHAALAASNPVAEANYLFASRIRTGVDLTTVDGLAHLEGREVLAWTDRGAMGPFTVSGGLVELPDPVNRATVGLFDATHLFETMDIVGQLAEGSGLGAAKRVKALGLRWHRTVAASMRCVEREFDGATVVGPWSEVTSRWAPNDLTTGLSGVQKTPLPSGYGKEITYQVRPVGGAPLTLLAITPLLDVSGG